MNSLKVIYPAAK